jgi:hypothetical protein
MDNNHSAEASSEAAGSAEQASTSEGQAQTQPDQFKNLKGEFNRKLSKMEQKLDAVLNAFNTTRPQVTTQAAEEAPEVDGDVKQYVDSILVQNNQKSSLQEAYEMFPELDPESDSFDEKFFNAVDAEFSSNLRKDPKGPLKAAKLMALELGKMEQLAQTKVLKDEARRSRILSEGSSTTREAKKDKDPSSQFNVKGLARLGINADKLAKRIKENKDKYEGL